MASADVATAKAKAATAINLIMLSSHVNLQQEDFPEGMPNKLNHRWTQFNMVGCRTATTRF
jgi:hypothetical protein